ALRALEDLAVHAQDVDSQLHGLLMSFGPVHLVAGAELGGVMRPIQGVGERAPPVDLHDLDLRPRGGQPLADERIIIGAPLTRYFEDLVVFLEEATMAGGGGGTALE